MFGSEDNEDNDEDEDEDEDDKDSNKVVVDDDDDDDDDEEEEEEEEEDNFGMVESTGNKTFWLLLLTESKSKLSDETPASNTVTDSLTDKTGISVSTRTAVRVCWESVDSILSIISKYYIRILFQLNY